MKKKAFQKLTALLAVTAMSVSLLTGCGSDASGSNDAATNNAQESATSAGTQEANSRASFLDQRGSSGDQHYGHGL